MFWRSIPRAVDVLARPDAEDYPRAPPARPYRPDAPPPSAPRADSDSSDDDDEGVDGGTSRPPSRAGAMRRAVHAVMAEERKRAPERMSDVVEAAMDKERCDKEHARGGLTGLLKKRKSVVGLFKKSIGRDGEGDGEQPRAASGPPGYAPSPPSSEHDEIRDARWDRRPTPVTGSLLHHPLDAKSLYVSVRRRPSRPPRRPPSPVRRMTATMYEDLPNFAPSARDRAVPAAMDPYERLLQQNIYLPRSTDGSSDDDSDSSSVLSASSRSLGSSRSAGSSYFAAPPSTASFTLPRARSPPPRPQPALPVSAYRSSASSAPPPRPPRPPSLALPASSSTHPSSPISPAPPYSGLVNLGNTCYLACVLQALAATEPFANFFANDDYLREINTTSRFGLKGQLAKAFARLIRTMQGGEYRSVSPAQLRDTIGRLSDQFLEPTQQDAHELLLALLDGLHEDLNLVATPPPVAPVSPQREAELERLPEVVAADQEWEKYRARNDSVIIDFFQGQMRNRMECMHCQQTSTTFSPLQTLSLSIPTPRTPRSVVTLSECIDEFLREEILQGENAWTLRSTSKRFSVARLPQTLIIHLKRFTPLSTKLTTRVELPLAPLPLGHLLPPFALDPPRGYALNAPHERRTTYELYAACCHLGEDGSGHYTTLLRRPSAPSASSASTPSFVLLDDESVDPLSAPGAQAAALRKAEETAYLLFFRLAQPSGGDS
ncbi:ubiquitin-specific protease doa4 [Rhodotorula kratochvilovae]